ncbi:hypothetical protein I7I53_09442 [Histoplasma capsulatum var. duboisii H88]|uniref:Uncharacterized protein n=1 Tax=Ajellomyces capsulatus (strain H88) TaxID=544711 RepID=A0A8A1L4Y8_AJEC8|nr:hypothetical protein I7I53_09442 [Histoplasma capsulatum var. duboisii H88]
MSTVQLHPVLPSQYTSEQTPLIQAHTLLTCQQPQTPVKNIVPREINKRRAYFISGHIQKINSAPDGALASR